MSPNLNTLAARYAKVVSGIQTHLATVASLVLGGATYAPADLVTLFQSWASAAAEVTTTKAQWQAAVLAEHTLRTKLQSLWLQLQTYARNQYGGDAATLADFGMTPPKTVEKSPETFVLAAAKNRATRIARHTMGKNQKKGIVGSVTEIEEPVPAPVPAPKA